MAAPLGVLGVDRWGSRVTLLVAALAVGGIIVVAGQGLPGPRDEPPAADAVSVAPVGDPAAMAALWCFSLGAFAPGLFGFAYAADIALHGDRIRYPAKGWSFPLAGLKISGAHNVANACTAIGLAAELGAGEAAITAALASFTGLDHRMVVAGEVDGVRYYDDSKGTNVGASVAALRGLTEPRVVLIAGGRDKLGAYEPLVDALRDRGRALVLIGEAADRIESAARGILPISRAATMRDAVATARELARSGDAVLLSPACSSFDMFRDYKDRGDAFTQAVRDLAPVAPERGAS